MSTLHSTGALTEKQHAAQDKIYAENHEYDVLIIGTGMAGLTAGALFANAGKKVCMLEAHDTPGGYAHTFHMGDYAFCAQIHYIWGCGEGEPINGFLKKVGLEKDITFEYFDPDGYDHMVMPDGKRVKIPYGFEQLAENIDAAYPGQKEAVLKFTKIMDKVGQELRNLPDRKIHWWDWWQVYKFWTLFKYRNHTLQQVFDECGLSKEAQAVLCANAGDMMEPPETMSFYAYRGLFAGYNVGAYYPSKHFDYYTSRVAQFITDHEGCHIYYETPVSKINIGEKGVESVETENGKTFTAKQYVCNADPQMAAKKLIGWEKIPTSFRENLSYEYSDSGVMVYLGLKDIDLSEYDFGSFNIWHMLQWDMNTIWKEEKADNFDKPWFFIATPTLHTDAPGTAPEGGSVMQIETLSDYGKCRELKDKDPKEYRKWKMAIAERLIDLVEEHYVPNLRDHIVVKVTGTASTNEDYVRAPEGNAYGSRLTPNNLSLKRLRAETPWSNLHWCNASSGYAGFYGTTVTGMNLYQELTGDKFYDYSKKPSDAELIAHIKKHWEEHKSERKAHSIRKPAAEKLSEAIEESETSKELA